MPPSDVLTPDVAIRPIVSENRENSKHKNGGAAYRAPVFNPASILAKPPA